MVIKILGSTWFTTLKNNFGIVVINNGYEEKAYIGAIKGVDPKYDEMCIADYGARFPLKQAKEIIGLK